MSALTRSRAGRDGVHSPLAVEHYRQRASARRSCTTVSPQAGVWRG